MPTRFRWTAATRGDRHVPPASRANRPAWLRCPTDNTLFIYNQRRHGEPGVWVAMVKPTADEFGIESNEIAWHAHADPEREFGRTQRMDRLAFGEPAVAVLPDNTLLLVLWCVQPGGAGDSIRETDVSIAIISNHPVCVLPTSC